MNIQAPITHTAGEESLFAAFDAAGNGSAGAQAAINQLRQNGLPTRRVESWHYTDLRGLVHNADTESFNAPSIAPFIDSAADIYGGVEGANLSDWTYQDVALDGLASDDAIGQINAAFANGGAIVNIAADTLIDTPLMLAQRGAHERHAIILGDNASAMIIQEFAGEAGFCSDVTLLKLGAKAKATFVMICEKGADATQLGQMRVSLGKQAELNIVVFNAGGKLIRREIVVDVDGENANLDIKGVNLIGGGSHIDVTTVLRHSVPNTNSNQLFRNIATDKGKGVFQGQISVHQIAQKTDARMACNTLLLSDDASFSAKPELEIFADDVICAHGATVTELDADHLFYLMARGIPARQAQALLVEAFVDEVVEELGDEALVAALEARITKWLEANG